MSGQDLVLAAMLLTAPPGGVEPPPGEAQWPAVRDARCEFYYITVRRHALKKLKDLIGDEAYQSATLPPNVPTWRFAEMR